MNNFLKYFIILSFIMVQNIAFAQSESDIQEKLSELQLQQRLNTINSDNKNKFKNNAKNQRAPNIENALNSTDQGINEQEKNEISVLQNYYKAITGNILKVYGEDEFDQKQDEELLFYNTTGSNYLLAPGDVIQVILRGLYPSSKTYAVDNDGVVIIDNLTPISVDGLSLEYVSNIILEKIRLDDASAEVFVKLKTARLITVQVSGNVNFPRTLAVPAYTPLSRVLAYSGGVSPTGSLRNIFLSQPGETTKNIDFYEFLQNPISTNDPLLNSNARIFVANKGPNFAATGFVARPGIYETLEGNDTILVAELMKLTGTSFTPPGATIKILYFDKDGKATSRIASKKDTIDQGEVLKVDFVETRELGISNISGAVINDYELTLNKAISIKEALKSGATLTKDAFLPFGLVNEKNGNSRVISIQDALNDESILLPKGANLRIFNKIEYTNLINADPNNTNDYIVSMVGKADLAEIYLNGKRIAYVPVASKKSFSKIVNEFYKPSSKTVYELALLEDRNSTKAISLKNAFNADTSISLNAGDRLYIFENTFYDKLMKTYTTNNTKNQANIDILDFNKAKYLNSDDLNEFQSLEELDRIEDVKKILQTANILKVMLDENIFSFLPFYKNINTSDILNILKQKLPKLVNEFVIIQDKNTNNIANIKNLNFPFIIEDNQNITLISQNKYSEILKNYNKLSKNNLMDNIKSSDAVKVFYNGKLSLLLSPNYAAHELKLFDIYHMNADFYQLYIGLKTKISGSNTWHRQSYDEKSFFSKQKEIILGSSNVIDLFSEPYIRNKFIKEKVSEFEMTFNINNDEKLSNDYVKETLDTDIINTDIYDYNIDILHNSLRTISGSVHYPGSYPVSDDVLLTDFISTAGGIVDGIYNTNIEIITAIEKEGRLVRGEVKSYKYDDIASKKIRLSGIYHLNVPYIINDAVNGLIEISGEILNPGSYSFSRTETIHDVIERAGGVSEVAFPLGAVLQRASMKEQESQNNQKLADKLESAILQIAQSDLKDTTDQISSLLIFLNNYVGKKFQEE